MIDQFSFQWIHVHVVELFGSLFQTPHVEIVESALPEARQRILAICKAQIELWDGLSFFAPQTARGALF